VTGNGVLTNCVALQIVATVKRLFVLYGSGKYGKRKIQFLLGAFVRDRNTGSLRGILYLKMIIAQLIFGGSDAKKLGFFTAIFTISVEFTEAD
jgi:hypothetical protein